MKLLVYPPDLLAGRYVNISDHVLQAAFKRTDAMSDLTKCICGVKCAVVSADPSTYLTPVNQLCRVLVSI